MSQIIPELINAKWHNSPNSISWTADGLHFETKLKTDFWQSTWYGFQRDDGHFLGLDAPQDFSATLKFDAAYEELYDQAGIMIRVDQNNWIKAGVEFSDGIRNISTVVTKAGHSDWSMIAAPDQTGAQKVMLTRIKGVVFVHYFTVAGTWQLMRLCKFTDDNAKVGPTACSPERSGLAVTISHFDITPPTDSPLHG